MKVADYIINFLARAGIKEVFVVYGSANGDLIDAFTREDKIRYIAVMHEQAGGFMAEAYSRVSGPFGVAIATSGPGGMNFTTPIANCFYDSISCLFITGQISTKYLRSDNAIRQVGFQESDMVSIMKPITKYAKMITDAKAVKYELEKAIYLMREGRPGPVLLDIPIDIQKQDIVVEELIGYNSGLPAGNYSNNYIITKISGLIEDLKNSSRPVILVGGGLKSKYDYNDDILKLGKRLGIPMIPTWNALDVIPSDYEYYGGNVGTYGGKGRNFAMQNCDLLIAIGCRISGRITGGNPKSFARNAKKYVIDVDDALLQPYLQQVPFDVCIKADALEFVRIFMEILNEKESQILFNFLDWNKRVRGWRDKYDPLKEENRLKVTGTVNPYDFARVLSKVAPSNSIIITDCGGNVVVMNQAFEVIQGQKFFSNNGNSPMGFSFAAAIGAWFASDKEQPVICVIGDGGMNMNIQELQTIINYGVNIKVFIMNNHIYGITKAFQETNFEGRAEACGPKGYTPPDFMRIADAYDIMGMNIEDPTHLLLQIEKVLEYKGAVICDVNCHEWHTYEPRIVGWNTPIEDMYPYLDREEFRENMIVDPLPNYLTPKMPDVVRK